MMEGRLTGFSGFAPILFHSRTYKLSILALLVFTWDPFIIPVIVVLFYHLKSFKIMANPGSLYRSPRSLRFIYLICFILIIPIGLSTRKYGTSMPWFIATYGGDTLYATCWFFFLRLLFIKPPVWQIVLYTYLVCICIETLQLYQAPWMIKLRHTPPMGLILGYGFLWSDWLCYDSGSLLAWLIGWLIERLSPAK